MAVSDHKVWWCDPSPVRVKPFPIRPYFSDVDMENSRLQDMASMSYALRTPAPYPAEFIPDELRWVAMSVPEKERDLPDAFLGSTGPPVISEALRDVLAKFDLGSSQFLECPLYDIKAKNKRGRNTADRSKQDPRRWFLLHISEVRDVVLPEHSKSLFESAQHPGFFHTSEGENSVVALDRERSLSGPPIWRDPKLNSVHFFNDAVKTEIEKRNLRTPALRFHPCVLI